jgi:hypothetical protein
MAPFQRDHFRQGGCEQPPIAHKGALFAIAAGPLDRPGGQNWTIPLSRQITVKPGQSAPASGEYQIIGPRGGEGAERTIVKGETAPPTPLAGSHYRLVRPAKNKAGRGRG